MGSNPDRPSLKVIPSGDRHEPDRCPWCGQPITHEKFEEIRERIRAQEQKQRAEFEQRLREQVAREKDAVEARARKAAEAALKPHLVEAERAKKAAEKQFETLKKTQQTSLNRRLAEQREALEKEKVNAVNAEKSRMAKENLKLEERVQLLHRQLQNKTAADLGEGAEIDLFDALRGKFPLDHITRVGKGREGADIIHEVLEDHRACGSIVYDSKNRNAWRGDYVSKLRRDQMAAKADHAVLATRVFPAGVRQLYMEGGVIVANPARALVIVEILRKHMVQIASLRLSNESRSDKMARLYNFITSDRFDQLLDQIETHTDDLLEVDVKEKKAHDTTWQRRGELIRAVQRVRVELASEIDRIVADSTAERSVAT